MELINDSIYQFEGGINPQELVDEFGCPLYVYESSIITRQYNRLHNAFKDVNLKLHFACKALNNINILRYMKKLGAGLDAVSIQEVKVGLLAGFDPQEIMYTPNCVSIDEIMDAVNLGVQINIDNISILEEFGHSRQDIPVCIRLNPHILAGGHKKISVGHIDSKFGISIHQLPLVERIVKATKLKINGIHMHTGSDILDANVFLEGAELLFEAAKKFNDLEFIDFGSGFKVPYKQDDYETDIEDLGETLGRRFNEFCSEYGKPLQLIFEPGKYLVSQSGTFLVRANVIKQTTSTVFVGIDSGLNHLIRPMLYDAHHLIVNTANPLGRNRIYTIVGYICETDTFGINRKLTEVKEGNILAIKNAGAYCFTMSSNYNSRFRPAEVFILDGQAHLIRKRETLKDILANQVEIPELSMPKVLEYSVKQILDTSEILDNDMQNILIKV